MNIACLVRDYIMSFKEREPILVKNLNISDEYKNARDVAFHRLERSGLIKKYKKGIYYKPQITPFGEIGIDKTKLIIELYIEENENIIGYMTGPVLWNKWGISTQIPKQKWITTNSVVRNSVNEDMNIRLIKPKVKVTKDNYKMLQILDFVEQIDDIQDIIWSDYVDILREKVLNLDNTELLKLTYLMSYYNKFVNNFMGCVLYETITNWYKYKRYDLILNKLMEVQKKASEGRKYKINKDIKFINWEKWGLIK